MANPVGTTKLFQLMFEGLVFESWEAAEQGIRDDVRYYAPGLDETEITSRFHEGVRSKVGSVTLISQREGSDLDLAKACNGMFRAYLYRLIKACAFNHVKTRYPLLGFGEWPIRFPDPAVSFANGDCLIHPGQTVARKSDSPAVHFGNP